MTAKDIDDLFDLLRLYFPNSPKTGSSTLKKAWLLILEPYGRGDVKQALLRLLRENEYFPDPQKIAALCPALPELDRGRSGGDAAARDYRRYMGPLLERFEAVKARRRRAGVPATIVEARKAGLSDREWGALLEERIS